MRSSLFIIAAAAAALAGSSAFAHPKLVGASPAPNRVVKPTNQVRLTFSEALIGKFSGAEVLMTDMPGMKMKGPMRVPGQASVTADHKSLVVTLPRPLGRGSYRLDWHVVSSDTHRVTGSYGFKIG